MVFLRTNNTDPNSDKRVQLPKLRHLSMYNYGMAIENMTT